MASYRDTLNLPETAFPMKGDLPKREPERMRWWSERGLYRKLRALRAGAPVQLLHDGPPYSNNHLHMGTAANKIWKDAVVKSASILGFDSPYVPGWDNHGMPIEIQVSKEFREKKQSPDRVELRRRCRSYADEWVTIQRDEFERLGVWGEWEHPYLTMDHAFEAEILETFRALANRGFVQRGLRSIHWCPTDRTALAEAEIEYQDDPSPSILVAFPLRNDARGTLEGLANVAALAWTTTPWTLPANLGLMIDPAATYAAVAVGDRVFVVAEARIAGVAEMAGWTSHDVKRRFGGKDLVGALFEAPWGNDSRVVDGTPYVSLDEGTGLVHTAPGHGKEDFAVGLREGLGVVNPVDEGGRFTAGTEPFVGRSVLEVNDDIIAWLKERGRLVAASRFTHSYPHCWRCRQPVIFRSTKQWFLMIDHDGHRARALEQIDQHVRWEPDSSRNRIRDAVRLRPDWCLSRQRSWGVGIPALYCEACGEPDLHDEVMARAAQVTREQGSDAWYELGVERFVPAGDSERNDLQARQALLDHVPVDPSRVHPVATSDGEYPDPVEAAAEYAAAVHAHLAEHGAFDLHLLGMGGEGHVNSLFPHTDAVREQHELVVAVPDSPKPPPVRVTLTLPAVRHSRHVVLVVGGAAKAEAVAAAVAGADPAEIPAAGAVGSESTTWLLDRAAAAALPGAAS